MIDTYELSVFNTVTRKYETVKVSKKIFDVYRRTGWNIKDRDKRFFAHEIQMSGLIGGDDGAYENFHEFIDAENTPENLFFEKERWEIGISALDVLTPKMRKRFILRYYYQCTMKGIAIIKGVSLDSVKESVEKAQVKLRKHFAFNNR